MDDPVRFISTVQVGITDLAILLGAIGEPLLSGPHGAAAVEHRGVPDLVRDSDVPLVVLGELVPKAVALQKAERLAIALAIPLDWLAGSPTRSSGFSDLGERRPSVCCA